MKRIGIFIFILSLLSIEAAAQDKIAKLKPQTSPAASILGLDASKLITPKSEQALITSVYSNFLNNSSAQGEFSLEFTPYWMKDHRLKFKEFIQPADLFSGQIVRNSSFSIAVTQKFLLGDSTNTTGIGLGYRTSIHFASENDIGIINRMETLLDSADRIRREIIAKIPAKYDEKKKYDAFLEDFLPEIEKVVRKNVKDKDNALLLTEQIGSVIKSIAEYPKGENIFIEAVDNKLFSILGIGEVFNSQKKYLAERQGLTIDIAAAAFLNFPDNNFEFSFSPKQALWIIPSYRFEGGMNFLNIMGAVRFEFCSLGYYKNYFPNAEYFSNNIDYGASIEADFDKFSIRFELTGRTGNSEIPAGIDNNGNPLYRKETGSDFQYIGEIGFRIDDQIMLNYKIGKKFKPEINPGNTLLSLLSINFGFGTPGVDKFKIAGK